MLVRDMDFVETVELLVNYKNALSSGEKQRLCENNKSPAIYQLPAEIKPCHQPSPIKDIIAQLFNGLNPLQPEHQKTLMHIFPSTEDIVRLERLVESLAQQIEYLKNTR